MMIETAIEVRRSSMVVTGDAGAVVTLPPVDDYEVQLLWDEAREQWLKAKRARSKGENTVRAYRAAHRLFFQWSRIRPWLVSTGVVQRWANWMREEGKVRVNRKTGAVVAREPLADSTVNQRLAALFDFYDFVTYRFQFPVTDEARLAPLVEAGLLFFVPDERYVTLWPVGRVNPFSAKVVERAKVSAFERSVYPSTEDVRAILASVNRRSLQGKRDYALLLTFAVTCRRSSEILNLRWGDIRELSEGSYAFRYRYKGGELRDAVLNGACYRAIEDYLAAAGRLDEMQGDDYIFTPLQPELVERLGGVCRPNTPISNTMMNKILKKYARRAGVDKEKAHVHGLRHAGARLRVEQMQRAGRVDLMEIMNLLGHSSLAVTQVYTAKVLLDPEDPGADAATAALVSRPRRRRRQGVAEE